MDERTALLRAVIAEPHSHLPRLVFADWLEEHGDAVRAEFIRTQCAYATLYPPCGGKHRADVPPDEEFGESAFGNAFAAVYETEIATDRRYSPEYDLTEAARERFRKLFDEHGNGWVADAARGIGLPVPTTDKISVWRAVKVLARVGKRNGWPYAWGPAGVTPADEPAALPPAFKALIFHGGFADELWVDPFHDGVADLVRGWKWTCPPRRLVLDSLEVGSFDEPGCRLSADDLTGVGTLTIAQVGGVQTSALCEVAYQAGITAVEFDGDQEALALLTASELFPTVTRLWLGTAASRNPAAFVGCPAPALQMLTIDDGILPEVYSDLDGQEAATRLVRLFQSPSFAGVTSVTLQNMRPSAELARAVHDRPAWRGLTRLAVDVPLGPAAVAAFADGDGLPALTELVLWFDRKTMTGPPVPPEPPAARFTKMPPTLPPRPARKERPPVAHVVWPGGSLPVARTLPVADAEVLPDSAFDDPPPDNGWAAALRALAQSPTVRCLSRLRLNVQPRRANTTDFDLWPIEGQPSIVSLPVAAVADLGTALGANPAFEKLEIGGVAVDAHGRAALLRSLGPRVAFV